MTNSSTNEPLIISFLKYLGDLFHESGSKVFTYCEKVDITQPTFRSFFSHPKFNKKANAEILDARMSDIMRMAKHLGMNVTIITETPNIKFVAGGDEPQMLKETFSFDINNNWGLWKKS